MLAQNLKGTGDKKCNCDSWAHHYVRGGGNWPETCRRVGCTEKAAVGAHILVSVLTGTWIAPLCNACNKIEGRFEIYSQTKLVSANVSKTCGK